MQGRGWALLQGGQGGLSSFIPVLLPRNAPGSPVWGGNAVGFIMHGWAVRANLGSNPKHISILLPQALMPTVEAAAGLLAQLGFHHSSPGLGAALQSRVLAGHQLYTSHFPSVFTPHAAGEPAAGSLHGPSLAGASPARQSRAPPRLPKLLLKRSLGD